MGIGKFTVIPLERIVEQQRKPIQCWTCGGWYRPGEYPKHVRSRRKDERHNRDQRIHVSAKGTVHR